MVPVILNLSFTPQQLYPTRKTTGTQEDDVQKGNIFCPCFKSNPGPQHVARCYTKSNVNSGSNQGSGSHPACGNFRQMHTMELEHLEIYSMLLMSCFTLFGYGLRTATFGTFA
jgi:hypothetical protein